MSARGFFSTRNRKKKVRDTKKGARYGSRNKEETSSGRDSKFIHFNFIVMQVSGMNFEGSYHTFLNVPET